MIKKILELQRMLKGIDKVKIKLKTISYSMLSYLIRSIKAHMVNVNASIYMKIYVKRDFVWAFVYQLFYVGSYIYKHFIRFLLRHRLSLEFQHLRHCYNAKQQKINSVENNESFITFPYFYVNNNNILHSHWIMFDLHCLWFPTSDIVLE